MDSDSISRNASCRVVRRTGTKLRRILSALIDGRRLTRFDAEQLGDHCLPSTVSALQRLGITIQREPVALEGRHGRFRCCVYWLAESDRPTALRIVGRATL
jgi:hypothetical protein